MSNTWTIQIRPPFRDDAWAFLQADFVSYQFWHAASREAALDRLRTALKSPNETYGDYPPLTPDNIRIDSHPDFEGAITTSQLAGTQTGLGRFKAESNTSTHEAWYKRQDEYQTYVTPLLDEPDQVLHVTSGSGTHDHPSDWSWNRSLWVVPSSTDPPRFTVVFHRPSNYEWTITHDVHRSELVRVLSGQWLASDTDSDHLKQHTLAKCRENENSSYRTWSPEEHRITDTVNTPFSDGWDYCPGVPSQINGWQYDPTASLGREVWHDGPAADIDDDHGRRVELHHGYDDFSFLKIYDARVSGADAAMVPNGFKRKQQADADPATLRERAIGWMAEHSPADVSHPAYDPRLQNAPPGWNADGRPGIRSSTEFHHSYRKAIDEDISQVITIVGPADSTDYSLELSYQTDEGVRIYRDQEPIMMPDEASLTVALSRVHKLANRLAETGISDAAQAHLQEYRSRTTPQHSDEEQSGPIETSATHP